MIYNELCPPYASFFGFAGASLAMVLCAIGSCYGVSNLKKETVKCCLILFCGRRRNLALVLLEWEPLDRSL